MYLADAKSYLFRQSRENKPVDSQDVFMEFSIRVMEKFAYNVGNLLVTKRPCIQLLPSLAVV